MSARVQLPKLQCLKSHRESRQSEPAQPQPQPQSTVVSAAIVPERSVATLGNLSQRWFELTFLLRTDMKTVAAFAHTQRVVADSLAFLAALSAMADRLGELPGTISRALLPFNSNTSVTDQAHVSAASTAQTGNDVLRDVDDKTRQRMKLQAIALRQLIKVKIADTADLQQARAALLSVQTFCHDTLEYSAVNELTLKEMLRKLNE